MPGSFERMIKLVNEVFDTKHDPDQISMTEAERTHLQQIHPVTMSEYADDDGPIVWILMMPTLNELMVRFLNKEISERQLLAETPVGVKYDTIYLCSASVLPEYRRKGLAKKITMDAIKKIMDDNPIRALFLWPFSKEGEELSRSVAEELNLPLYLRPGH